MIINKLPSVKKVILFIFFINFASFNFLKAEFFFNDYINGSVNYNSNSKELDSESDFASLRLDNRVVAGYKNSFFKFETHLITSVSNFSNSALQIPIDLVIEDDRTELFNLSTTYQDTNYNIVNKLDRLNFSFYGSNYNLSVGRDTLTWSRGRMFHVTDFFNPQIPGFYDGDYKPGTDLVSFSYGFSGTQSIAIAFNPKRDYLTEELTIEDSNMGFRYLYSNDSVDVSLILGQYLKDYVIGAGFSADFLLASVLRADFTITKPYEDRKENIASTVIGVEKSLLLGDTFASIFAEYYHNGFGTDESLNSLDSLAKLSPSLIRRLQEQDTYLLSQDYLALGANFELGTYFYVSYSNIISLKDGSAFHFLGASYNYSQRADLSLSVGLPYGYANEEFGQICPQDNPESCVKMGALVLFGFSYAI